MLLQGWDHPARYDLDAPPSSPSSGCYVHPDLLPDLATRADLGHLGYLSVQQQCYLVLLSARAGPGALAPGPGRGLCCGHRRGHGLAVARARDSRLDRGLQGGRSPAVTGSCSGCCWPRHCRGCRGALAGHAGHCRCRPWLGSGSCRCGGELPFVRLPQGLGRRVHAGLRGARGGRGPGSTFRVHDAGALAAPVAAVGRASLALYVWHLPVILLVSQHLAGRPGRPDRCGRPGRRRDRRGQRALRRRPRACVAEDAPATRPAWCRDRRTTHPRSRCSTRTRRC